MEEEPNNIIKLSYFDRRLFEAGILEPCNRGFYVNWTTVIGFMLVMLTIIGLWAFTYQVASKTGYQQASAETERQELRRRLDLQEARMAENERLLRLAVNPIETTIIEEK
jgi:hypothetical protein